MMMQDGSFFPAQEQFQMVVKEIYFRSKMSASNSISHKMKTRLKLDLLSQ